MKNFLSFLAISTIVLGMTSCGGNDPAGPFVINPNSENGMMPGLFTVDNEGKQVHFSQGNLQYNDSLKLWRFATNQWDTIGTANKHIGKADYDGWIDLFGWNTGETPTKSIQSTDDYKVPFKDWGENAIANGGNQTGWWRTPSADEWIYMISGRVNAEKLFGLGTVAGMNGLILLPDEWEMPKDVPDFQPSTEKHLVWNGYDGYYRNTNNDNFYHNTYTAEQWDTMEKAGAIFLPAAGMRTNTKVEYLTSIGYYWSATPKGEYYAYNLLFDWSRLWPLYGLAYRYAGESVRLVR